MRLTVHGVALEIAGRRIVNGVDLVVEPAQFVGIVGPNGSGKTTLLRSIYRVLRPAVGAVLVDEDDLWRLSAREAARRRAIVTQHGGGEADFSVLEVVTMGRAAHKRMLERDGRGDRAIVEDALERVGMSWAAPRLFATLSGGERQRVLVARALAQRAPMLVLDEPTNHLDVRAQLELLELLRELRLTTLAVLHDLDQAAAYCDAVTVLCDGSVAGAGTPADVLTPELIAAVFGVRAHVAPHPITRRPHIAVAPLQPRREAGRPF